MFGLQEIDVKIIFGISTSTLEIGDLETTYLVAVFTLVTHSGWEDCGLIRN
jgi:hypothetical protein